MSGAGAGESVLLVARTHHRGIEAAQLAVREWASDTVPVGLVGLVFIADAPRVPRSTRHRAESVASGAPRAWFIDWCEAWRFEPATGENAAGSVRKTLNELAAVAASISHTSNSRNHPG